MKRFAELNEQEIQHFRSRFEIPIPDEAARNASFYRPPDLAAVLGLGATAAMFFMKREAATPTNF